MLLRQAVLLSLPPCTYMFVHTSLPQPESLLGWILSCGVVCLHLNGAQTCDALGPHLTSFYSWLF